MPSALIISRYFPPIGSAGASIRVTKFIKVALRKNWSIRVITQDPEKQVTPEKLLCGFLLDELPPDLPILRVPNPIFGKRLARIFWGDSSLPWGAACVPAGIDLLKQYPVDLILANTPPFTNVAIGATLSRSLCCPLVIDFKDDWVGSAAFSRKNRLRQLLEAAVEKAIVQIASGVVVVTQASYDMYTQRYPQEDKFFLIPNGQDLEEYKALEGKPRKIETQKFTFLTAASGYRGNYRDLTPLIRILKLFLQRHPSSKDQINVVFLGDVPGEEYQEEIRRSGLESMFQSIQAVNRKALVEWLWKSDLFFLIQPHNNYTAISGTLYEYWATGKAPVMLISEDGASSSIVENNHLGKHFHFEEIDEAVYYLERIYMAYRSGVPVWIERTGVEQHDRKAIAEKMITCWEKILHKKHEPQSEPKLTARDQL